MKRLLAYLFIVLGLGLTFSFQTLSKADDISELQIEGISIGESLLEYYSEEEIIKNRLCFLVEFIIYTYKTLLTERWLSG